MKVSAQKGARRDTNEEEEQRRSERFDLSLPVKVNIVCRGRRSTLAGEGYNVSKSGMRLFVSCALEPGAPLILEFVLPYTSTPMVLRGIVRNRTDFTYGVEFSKVTSYQQSMLERNCSVLNLLR